MAEPTPFALAQLYSQLLGREISFALTPKAAPSKEKPMYGAYTVLPGNGTLVVKADLAMLGSLAGALLGLPGETAAERALETPMNEPVRDAIHELLNITSTALSIDGRAVFQGMAVDPVYCSGEVVDLVNAPDQTSLYAVTIDGKMGGQFSVLSRF